ncbi:zinc finger BED domain-containing protein 4-like [Rhizophagus clarus]|uniref:Zinc finger BED domain-containing protein 4-like n=1 Tax=Rhizophagus clarus TaxID=94130 RepID=A0A8H3LIQ3_9GLOM|nr:zinc finger BED domain-containing protein 4-like [Rhizophagus clarus]
MSNSIQDKDIDEVIDQNPLEKEKGYNLKGEQTRTCNILDDNGKRCEFARSYRPHLKHIQKQREESVLKWMLLTDQPLATITNPAYKEKIAQFDPSRAKHGYLGITATWITSDFKVKGVMLEIKYAPSPHTADVVAKLLYECISSWDLNGCVTAIITDNSSNIKAAFPILTQKNQCEDIQRHPCVAHMLQLSIGKSLAPVEILAAYVKRIINFFSIQKQIERLEAVQRKLGYEDDAIIQLQTDLYTSTNRKNRKDATSSIDSPSNDIDYNNENTIFEKTELEVDSEEIISHITKKRIFIKDPLNTERVLLKVKNNIYNALLYYWDTPSVIGLMATLLDLRYKELDLELEDKKDEIIQKLRDKFNGLNSDNLNKSTPVTLVTEPYNTTVPVSDAETSFNYLSMPVALETENPLDWWQIRKEIFPNLSQIAHKYLGVPATSVSSERLFSHAGSIISVKRNRLDTSLVGQMLFLKRNIRSMEVFVKE